MSSYTSEKVSRRRTKQICFPLGYQLGSGSHHVSAENIKHYSIFVMI